MLKTVGASSLDALIDEAILVPSGYTTPLNLPPRRANINICGVWARLAQRNTHSAPTSGSVITTPSRQASSMRMVMENPGWYTP
jgi:glycine dehydrogenase